LFAAFGIVATVMLVLYPRELITVLFTAKHLGGAGPLVGMAPLTGLVALGNLLVWTLVAYGRLRWALAGALAQFTVLAGAVSVAVAVPDLPLGWLGAGHTLAAAAGAAVWAVGLRRVGREHTWHPRRLAAASGMALAVGALLHQAAPGAALDRPAAAALLAAAALGMALPTAAIAMPQAMGSLSIRLARGRAWAPST
jgi:O-antigen/teichoic acid export membrane protein